MLLIAHRCGLDRYPELTLEAAQYSLAIGADYVEIDIRMTADGMPVICHDESAKRLFGRDALVKDIPCANFVSLARVEGKAWHGLTLDDVLSAGIMPILFHMKESGKRLEFALMLIKERGYAKQVMIGVSHLEDVDRVRSVDPAMRALAFMRRQEDMNAFIAEKVEVIRLWSNWASAERIKQAHAHGIQVWVMAGRSGDSSVGIAEEADVKAWGAMGADGVLVNEVAKFRSICSGR